jgi:hypothetical protein
MKPEDKAVVQQALETFKKLPILAWTPESAHEIVAAMTALCQLLERTEQEPDEWLTGCPECGMESGCDCDSGTWNPPAQSADHADELTIAYLDGVHTGKRLVKREWVGLTDEDIAEAGQLNVEGPRMLPYSFARAIEAKLCEKNGGA